MSQILILILILASNYSLDHLIVFLYHCGHSSYHWSQSILMTSCYEHLLRCISSYLDFASKLCKICVNPVKVTSSPASARIHSQPPAFPQKQQSRNRSVFTRFDSGSPVISLNLFIFRLRHSVLQSVQTQQYQEGHCRPGLILSQSESHWLHWQMH